MKKVVMITLAAVFCASLTIAADTDIKVSADLELFYELSDDVAGENDGDKFKSNQLYVKFDGEFDNDLSARVVLDGADIVSSDGGTVKGEKIIEEANFTFKNIGGAPVTVVFGKDEMPFGLDWDKYLNDSIAHQFEIDKVWGLHAIVDIADVGSVAAASYQHRRSLKDDEALADSDNEFGDSYTARITVDELVDSLKVVLSASSEAYGDLIVTDDAGATTVSKRSDETRLGAGVVIDCPVSKGTFNAEYIAFCNRDGVPGYHPKLATLGAEFPVGEQVKLWGRYEIVDEDTDYPVETDFWSVGVVYAPVENYQFLVEYSNFNSGDMKDAPSLRVADGSIEDALLLGVKAAF